MFDWLVSVCASSLLPEATPKVWFLANEHEKEGMPQC